MKIAVLSDIHGDFDKLKMILDQIQGADKLVLLGDLYVGGDFPSACRTFPNQKKLESMKEYSFRFQLIFSLRGCFEGCSCRKKQQNGKSAAAVQVTS